MKISLTFDTVQEGLAAISLLAGAVETDDDTTTSTAPGTVDPVLGVELDANGMPWVAEVHAGTKGKNKDGTWKKGKGVTDEARVAGEVRALAHLRATAAPAPGNGLAGGGGAGPVTIAPVVTAVVGAMPGLPVMPATAALPPISYEQLTEKYATLAAAGTITAAHMQGIYAEAGINPTELGTNETARRAVYDALIKFEVAAQAAAMPGMPGA